MRCSVDLILPRSPHSSTERLDDAARHLGSSNMTARATAAGGGGLFRFGVQQLGNNGLAEEMVLVTFGRLWRPAGRFDANGASVQAYPYVIARSVAADIRKRPSSRSGARKLART